MNKNIKQPSKLNKQPLNANPTKRPLGSYNNPSKGNREPDQKGW